MSATPDSRFTTPEQRIADLERQLAECRAERDACKAERDEMLEQQTATAEVLQVINASLGELSPVLEAILEKAHDLCGATHGAIGTYDNNFYFRTIATRGYPEPLTKRLRQGFAGWTNPLTSPLIDGGAFVHVPDLAAIDHPIPKTGAELGGFRTGLFVPLRKDGILLGMLVATRAEIRLFTDKQIALLQNFAAEAVIAMENARLLTETRETLEQQTATAAVLRAINSSQGNLKPVFDAILERAVRLCEASCGQFATYDGAFFRFVATHGEIAFVRRQLARSPMAPSWGVTWSLQMKGENTVHIVDVKDTEVYQSGHEGARRFVDIDGGRTLLSIALRKEEALLGTITIYRHEVRPFSEKQIALLEGFADQAVIAIENARLLGELRQRADEVADLNRGLEVRVAEQVEELGRVGRLKRFLAPQLAELIVSRGDEKILESHRREVVVVFCDLRGYTAFTETAEPEQVLEFLRQYHGALGPLVSQFEGTLDHFSGDGIMVFFNDPMPCPDPAERAVKMAVAMREAAGALTTAWRERGRDLEFGAGIAQGYATLGQIGFSELSGYTAIGTVCNVAARLCAEAKDGQILLSQRVNAGLKGSVTTEVVGALALKGLTQPIVAYNVPLAAR